MNMDLNARKHEFIQQLTHVNEALFEQLENVLKKGLKNNHQEISAEQLREDALMAEVEEDIKEGRLYSQKEVKDLIKSWTK